MSRKAKLTVLAYSMGIVGVLMFSFGLGIIVEAWISDPKVQSLVVFAWLFTIFYWGLHFESQLAKKLVNRRKK